MHSSDYPLVSFVIPTLNAANILPKCLQTIRDQKYPKNKIEIMVSDGGSTDETIQIAQSYGAKVIHNPEILHEPGKARGALVAKGDIIFFTDADNILALPNWLILMTKPYRDNKNIFGFLPQTIPAPDSNPLDQYLGFICTDPFTWFVYGYGANPSDYPKIFKPLEKKSDYFVYKFDHMNHPLFGLSQGVGINKKFNRDGMGHSDDILAGIKLIQEGGLIACVPKAEVYHYHVSGIRNFIRKYRWRVRNNIQQSVRNMGIVNRLHYFNLEKKIKIILFFPYAFSIIFPCFDAVKLTYRYRNPILFLHVPVTFLLALIIVQESISSFLFRNKPVGRYE